MQQEKPLFLIITANDGELSVEEEGRSIVKALQPAKAAQQIYTEYLPNADIQTLEQTFLEYEKNHQHINFIHYAGHADGQQLMLDSANAFGAGLSSLFQNTNIVFLNGCATLGHVHQLHEQGVEAIIATNTMVNDERAKQFARSFYQALGSGHSIQSSFQKAVAALLTRYDDKYFEKSKKGLKLKRNTKHQETNWELHYLNETILNWTIHQPVTGQQHLNQIDGLGIYLDKVQQNFNKVRVFGMLKPVPLKDLYVNASILKEMTEHRRIDLEALKKDKTAIVTRPAEQIAIENQYLLILGKPGGGKTTFLKSLALKSVTVQNRSIPIFINLKAFGDEKIRLFDFIVEEFEDNGFDDASVFIKEHLKKGGFQILLDGLDEVTNSEQGFVREQIKRFIKRYDKNQFVITCRIAAYKGWFDNFMEVEIADFTDTQVRLFIENYFKGNSTIANNCWKAIQNNSRLIELSKIPLLLTLLCLSYEENNYFPPNKAKLYGVTIKALLKRWDSFRSIERKTYENLSIKRKEMMFSYIAYTSFAKDEFFFPSRTLEHYIATFLQELEDKKNIDFNLESETVLESIVIQHHIFMLKTKDIYSFAHLTFQEYFCAKYIVESEQRQNELITQHLTDSKWKEVFLLVSGMLPNEESADKFILLMKSQIKLPTDRQLFNDINQIVNHSSYYSPLGQKILLLFLVINNEHCKYLANNKEISYLTIAYYNGLRVAFDRLIKTLDNQQNYLMITDLAASLSKKTHKDSIKILKLKTLKETSQKDLDDSNELTNILQEEINNFSDELQSMFDLNFDLNEFNYQSNFDFDSLETYLFQNVRLIESLQSDIYMSKKLQKEILDNLFTMS